MPKQNMYTPPKEIMDILYSEVVGTAIEKSMTVKEIKQAGERSASDVKRENRMQFPYHCVDFTFFTIQKLKEHGFDPVLVVDTFKLPSRDYVSEHAIIEVKIKGKWHTINFQEGLDGKPNLIIHKGKHQGMVFSGENISRKIERHNTEKFTPHTKPVEIVPGMVKRAKERLPTRLKRGDLPQHPENRILKVRFRKMPIK